jgi:hypothetical protein
LLGRAYRLYRQRDDRPGAARVAFYLALSELYFRMEPAVARGWIERAERLLEGLPATAEAGWLTLLRGHLALQLDRDLDAVLEHAARAGAIGKEVGDLDVEMFALAQRGLALVASGQVDDGM